MKKLLEKPWAKALAFLLTLLPGTAAVYGGVELVYICVYNMHTDRRLDMLWAVTAVCAVVAAASLVFSLSAAGHWPGHEGIHLTWVEKIPVDLFVLGLTCVWYIYLDAVYYPSATLGLAVFVALAYLFVLAFTARCKAGTVLSDLLALRLLRLFSRGAVWTWRHLRRLFLGLPLAWKTAAVLLAVMAADLLIFAYGMDGGQAALYVTLHLVLLGAAIWQVLALRQLQQGGEKLAEGDFSHPVTLSRGTLPELKRHAENLNSVQVGIQRAVEEKMKSERLKTQLITNVSHDIKTPLTSIVSYVDLLKKGGDALRRGAGVSGGAGPAVPAAAEADGGPGGGVQGIHGEYTGIAGPYGPERAAEPGVRRVSAAAGGPGAGAGAGSVPAGAGGHGRRAAAVAGAGQPDEQHLQIRHARDKGVSVHGGGSCLLYTSPSPRD